GITKKTIKVLQKSKRLIDMVSRGGAIIYKWMITHNKENPLYSRFDEVIDIAREFDITLSLGDGMRPGAIADATDEAQIEELKTLGELQERALKKGVQVIIEGPGHIPINEIKKNVDLEKSICHGAPFYVLGPLVIDVAPGYDHITSAIGGAMAAACGADFLCYVTPSEHLRLPTIQDVKEGLIASKIAAHAADVAKGKKEVLEQDISISKARRKRNWKEQFALSLDPVKAIEYRRKSIPSHTDVCTMCSEYCPIKISQRYKKK
ncbi:MAG: phosphomethylpyrimidine synthase ThiC, partial [Candidatus Omnitrophica bacterium]|nr:phosphomethylpyrimidine synthase ThiC [Candidatus Omnitrophota bacterium]